MDNSLKWVALIGISLLGFVVFFDFTIVNTALPFIQASFHSSVLELQWVANIFTMVLTIAMLPVGRIADLFGRKKVLYWGVIIFALAVLGAGCSLSLNHLMIFRGLQGFGVAILLVVSASLISEIFPKKEHRYAVSVYGGITGLGLASGPFIGGLLIEWLSWRWVFWINLPIVMTGLVCCIISLKLPSLPQKNIKIAWKNLFLLLVSLSGLIYGIIILSEEAKAIIAAWPILIGGLLLLVFFFICESKSNFPILDLSIFKNKLLLLPILSCFIAGIISCVFMFFDSLYLRNFRDFSAIKVGLLITIIPVMQVVISFLFHFLLKWFRTYTLMLISIIAAFIGIAAHHLIGLYSSLTFLIFSFGLLGITWGISNTGTIFIVNQFINKDKVGVTLGTIFTIWNMMGAIFLAISSVIFHFQEGISFINAFHATVNFNAVFCFLLLIISIGMFIRFKRQN